MTQGTTTMGMTTETTTATTTTKDDAIAFGSSRFFYDRSGRQAGRQGTGGEEGNGASDKRGGKGQEEGFLEKETHNIELLFQWRRSPDEEAHCP